MAIADLPRRPKLEEVIRVPVREQDKRRVYEAAAARSLTRDRPRRGPPTALAVGDTGSLHAINVI